VLEQVLQQQQVKGGRWWVTVRIFNLITLQQLD
jgi:hypothetical protein